MANGQAEPIPVWDWYFNDQGQFDQAAFIDDLTKWQNKYGVLDDSTLTQVLGPLAQAQTPPYQPPPDSAAARLGPQASAPGPIVGQQPPPASSLTGGTTEPAPVEFPVVRPTRQPVNDAQPGQDNTADGTWTPGNMPAIPDSWMGDIQNWAQPYQDQFMQAYQAGDEATWQEVRNEAQANTYGDQRAQPDGEGTVLPGGQRGFASGATDLMDFAQLTKGRSTGIGDSSLNLMDNLLPSERPSATRSTQPVNANSGAFANTDTGNDRPRSTPRFGGVADLVRDSLGGGGLPRERPRRRLSSPYAKTPKKDSPPASSPSDRLGGLRPRRP